MQSSCAFLCFSLWTHHGYAESAGTAEVAYEEGSFRKMPTESLGQAYADCKGRLLAVLKKNAAAAAQLWIV